MAEQEVKISAAQAMTAFRNEQAKIETLERRIAAERQILGEITSAKEALAELKKEGKGIKTMVPLGAGIYIEASIENPKEVKKSLAGNILTSVESGNLLKELEKQAAEVEQNLSKLVGEHEITARNIDSWGKIIGHMQRQAQAAKTK